MKPGATNLPPRSMTVSAPDLYFITSRLLPMAMIVSPETAIASAYGCSAFPVHILAFVMIISDVCVETLHETAISTRMTAAGKNVFFI